LLRQGVFDVLKTLSDFDHGVLTPVFIFNVGGDVVLLLFQKL